MENKIDYTIFFVNEEPYCIWDIDLKKRNNEFLEGIDIEYFDYLVKVYLESSDDKRKSIAIRTEYHHAMETLYSLLFAYLQSPDCVYAWIAKYLNKDICEIINKINQNNKNLFTRIKLKELSWESIINAIFQNSSIEKEKKNRIIQLYAKFLHRLSIEYLDENRILEYNSIKHGFRIKSGGFALKIGKEHKYGVSPPENEMNLLGQSKYGSSFYKLESIGNKKRNRSTQTKHIFLNWKIEQIYLLIQLISMTISNVTSSLKIFNGYNPTKLKFCWPKDLKDFEKPWQFTPRVTNFHFNYNIKPSEVKIFTRKDLLEILKK